MNEWNAETAEWYAAKYGDYATNGLAVDALELEADAVVIDVGCGTGSALRRAAIHVTKGRLIGIDPVPRMIEIAEEQTASHPAVTRIEFREGAAEALPVEDDAADVVLALDSIDHWSDRERGLAEVWRVLRPGGQLVLAKDGAVPGGAARRRDLPDELRRAGFRITREQEIEAEEVALTLWVCEAS